MQKKMRKEKRTDEECVYDVHKFVNRYILNLKACSITFSKEQIGVLENMLLAENPVPVKSSQEYEREKLLDAPVDICLMKRLTSEDYPSSRLLRLITYFSIAKGSRKIDFDAFSVNRDALRLYEKSYIIEEGKYAIDLGEYPSKFKKTIYELLETYLREKCLLPPKRESMCRSNRYDTT